MGPRPLPLHLGAALTALGCSPIALTSLISGCSSSSGNGLHPNLQEKAADLSADLQNALRQNATEPAIGAFFQALDEEIRDRTDRFLSGIEAYRNHSYHRDLPPTDTLTRFGSTHVQDFGGTGEPVLLVPSLVNRGYILDLSTDCSLARWLADQGCHPYLVEWGMPGEPETGFGLEDYIGRLTQVLRLLNQRHGQPVTLLGYCMGGLLTLAASIQSPDLIRRQILMATPWDFHSDGGKQSAILGSMRPWLDSVIATYDLLPTDILQMFFTLLDPLLGLIKFSRFADMDPSSEQARAFVALEDWLNDGVPLTGGAARACIQDWYGANKTGKGEWQVDGRAIRPQDCATSTLCLIPSNDRIVPPASARALAGRLQNATIVSPHAGHIGMVASRRSRETVWEEIRKFSHS